MKGAWFKQGFAQGYRLGRCETLLAAPEPSLPRSSLRILYVQQGFEAIDSGVCDALVALTAECRIVGPHEMLEAALEMRPHAVLIMNGLHVFPNTHLEHVGRIRAEGIRTVVWFVDDPYFSEHTAQAAPYYDVIFTHERDCVPFYKAIGCAQVHHVPLGVNTRTFRPMKVMPTHVHDVGFIGNAFRNRVALFDQLADFLLQYDIRIGGGFWDRLAMYDRYSKAIRKEWTVPLDCCHFYNGAKIVLNIHRPVDPGNDNHNVHGLTGSSLNPRTYEIAACGTLQMTDVRSELAEMYTPGVDIVTFESPQDLMEKIRYYLSHEQERLEIALRAVQTTFNKHRYEHRVHRLLEWLA